MNKIEDIANHLNQLVDKENLKSRSAGKSGDVSYIDGAYTQTTLDEVFGVDGWSFKVKERPALISDETIKKTGSGNSWDESRVTFAATVSLEVSYLVNDQIRTKIVENCGTCDNQNSNRSEAVQIAYKGAITDGIKRCANMLGNIFSRGLGKTGQTYIVGQTTTKADDDRKQTNSTQPAKASQVNNNENRVQSQPAVKETSAKTPSAAAEKPAEANQAVTNNSMPFAMDDFDDNDQNDAINNLIADMDQNISKRGIEENDRPNWIDIFSSVATSHEQARKIENPDEKARAIKKSQSYYELLLSTLIKHRDIIDNSPLRHLRTDWVNSLNRKVGLKKNATEIFSIITAPDFKNLDEYFVIQNSKAA
jgi:recombination DNA repair RAD52 pathway protein